MFLLFQSVFIVSHSSIPFEEGGGSEGILIITKDDDRGGIRPDEIEKLVEDVLCS